ncbi:hypothetical protein HAX54_039516 [Datura stramonium]|uniref:Uncharacterized protein n=1 Tax=Datura stramonium TaxID=4076 RepID=A0ABS8SJ06_DATST|nr:hypothetical protein [Datura stramonium]
MKEQTGRFTTRGRVTCGLTAKYGREEMVNGRSGKMRKWKALGRPVVQKGSELVHNDLVKVEGEKDPVIVRRPRRLRRKNRGKEEGERGGNSGEVSKWVVSKLLPKLWWFGGRCEGEGRGRGGRR